MTGEDIVERERARSVQRRIAAQKGQTAPDFSEMENKEKIIPNLDEDMMNCVHCLGKDDEDDESLESREGKE